MKKKLTLLVIMILATSKILAEAPEMQEYLPSEWKYMNKYDGNLRQKILDLISQQKSSYNSKSDFVYAVSNEYGGIEEISQYWKLLETNTLNANKKITLHPNPDGYILYEEKLNEHTFYYYVEYESVDYPINMSIMYLNENGELIAFSPVNYNCPDPIQRRGILYGTYLIPGKQGKIKAVCRSENFVGEYKKDKGGKSYIYYQLLDKKPITYSRSFGATEDEAKFFTETFLFDKTNPLKYALFNAFDGDLSTSYVEDSEDNLIDINFSWRLMRYFPGGFSEVKIINGYAKNENLYKKNNRIKTIRAGGDGFDGPTIELDETHSFLDDTLDWQKCNFAFEENFLVRDIYKGTHYNDTCMAELDFKYNGHKKDKMIPDIEPIGWLFSSEPDNE